MGVYVAEINGRGIAAVNADQISDAEEFVKNPAIEIELMVLENDGCGMAKRRSACDQLSRKSRLLGEISRTKQYAKTRSMGINSHPGYASSCPLSILPTPSRYSLEPIELLPRVI